MPELATALTDKHFIDWESSVFGYGYGTGEEYTIKAMLDFLALLKEGRRYDHNEVEAALGPTSAWLLINILCSVGIIDYGTSPRYGFLSNKGELLRDYMSSKTVEELCELTSTDEDHIHCYPGVCNCNAVGAEPCNNPLFALLG
jgi:hypothetical protein